jgi:two-component system OmpR family sensor kinase
MGTWRVRVIRGPGGDGFVVNAVSLTELESTQDTLLAINVTVTAAVLLLLAVATATVVRVGLRPLTRMEQTAARIAAGDLPSASSTPTSTPSPADSASR